MIKFLNENKEPPFLLFKEKYNDALSLKQNAIEAISISSYNKAEEEISSRYVNLKIIDNKSFIFFSNYDSPKSIDFNGHDQISALIYWNSINTQIRIKAKIKRTSKTFNKRYFKDRSKEKNALAISSNQSNKIESFNEVKQKYANTIENNDLIECPDYWGGFEFIPYYFEFWEGHKNRLNHRTEFCYVKNEWLKSILEP